jgi:hypothetical protein
MRSCLRDPADRFWFDRPQPCATTTLDTAKKNKDTLKRDMLKKKTTYWFSELALKLEIINSSLEFVAFF